MASASSGSKGPPPNLRKTNSKHSKAEHEVAQEESNCAGYVAKGPQCTGWASSNTPCGHSDPRTGRSGTYNKQARRGTSVAQTSVLDPETGVCARASMVLK